MNAKSNTTNGMVDRHATADDGATGTALSLELMLLHPFPLQM